MSTRPGHGAAASCRRDKPRGNGGRANFSPQDRDWDLGRPWNEILLRFPIVVPSARLPVARFAATRGAENMHTTFQVPRQISRQTPPLTRRRALQLAGAAAVGGL